MRTRTVEDHYKILGKVGAGEFNHIDRRALLRLELPLLSIVGPWYLSTNGRWIYFPV